MLARTQRTVTALSRSAIQKRYASKIAQRLAIDDLKNRFPGADLAGKVVINTGGAQGLGLNLAEGLVKLGVHIYGLDWAEKPSEDFHKTQKLADQFGGSLHFRRVDVSKADELDSVIAEVAAKHGRLDGLIAGAAVQNVCPAIDYPPEKVAHMMSINYAGVLFSAQSCARQMMKYNCPGSMVLIGSMSGLIANRDLLCPVYNSSKAAVIQLGRNLAMEWCKAIEVDGETLPIRVNTLCPGNIVTPMVLNDFKNDPSLKEKWEDWNMLGRLSKPHEYQGAVIFMLSDSSSFMTGSHLVIDGGYTAW